MNSFVNILNILRRGYGKCVFLSMILDLFIQFVFRTPFSGCLWLSKQRLNAREKLEYHDKD